MREVYAEEVEVQEPSTLAVAAAAYSAAMSVLDHLTVEAEDLNEQTKMAFAAVSRQRQVVEKAAQELLAAAATA